MFELRIPAGLAVESEWIASYILVDFLGLSAFIQESDIDEFVLCHDGRTLTLPSIFLANAKKTWLSPSSLAKLPLDQWDFAESGLDARLVHDEIPVLFGASGFHLDSAGNGHLNLDVFGSVPDVSRS